MAPDTDDRRLIRLENKVDKILAAVYEGNGVPPLMTRVDRLEQRVRSGRGWWDFAKSIAIALVTVAVTLWGTGAI